MFVINLFYQIYVLITIFAFTNVVSDYVNNDALIMWMFIGQKSYPGLYTCPYSISFVGPSILTIGLGAQKNHLIEMVLLSTHNICFDACLKSTHLHTSYGPSSHELAHIF